MLLLLFVTYIWSLKFSNTSYAPRFHLREYVGPVRGTVISYKQIIIVTKKMKIKIT